MSRELCIKCGRIIDKRANPDADYHPGCEPKVAVVFGNPDGMTVRDPFTEQIRMDLMEVIRWADANAARSQQTQIGPSELGHECDRYLAYKLANWPAVNTMTDPWPAIVGTAIHKWLEEAVNNFQQAAGARRWTTEVTVHPDNNVRGHMDLFDHWEHMVCDWKSLGPTKMKMWQKSGPPEKHKDQVNLYAKGVAELGREVRKVCLIGIPRAGWLSDMEVWVGDYEPDRAQRALERMYEIGGKVTEVDVFTNPHLFNEFTAVPDMCNFCPYFRPTRREGTIADASGCPGR